MKEFDDIVREAKSEDLTGTEVLELFPNQLGFLLYERLYEFNNLLDVLQGKDGVIILYQYTKYQGHYCLLMRHKNGDVEWFDSLGYQPDYELKYMPYDKEPQLSTLIRRYENSGGKVVINKNKFQRDTDNISTCGRHCIVRYAFREMNLTEYTVFLKTTKIGYDNLVTIMTLIIKH